MRRCLALLFPILAMFGCQAKGTHSTSLDQFFSDPQQTIWCQHLPGMMLEMGTDIELNNNQYCFEKTKNRVVLSISSAHHYLDESHPLVVGSILCRGGDISESTEWLQLDWKPTGELMFLEKRQVCGPYGCAYQLNYVSQVAESECQGLNQLGD